MYDLLIKGGMIIDGTGAEPYRGDVGVIDDRIAEIGTLSSDGVPLILDVAGAAVAPGFIDIHSHHDWYLLEDDHLSKFESFVRQGVTTCVVGNCGWTAAPCLPKTRHLLLQQLRSMGVMVDNLPWDTMAEYLNYIENRGLVCNIAQLAGHGALRIAVMGEENRFCTPEELADMQALLRECMEAGCVGFSTGLMYYPGMYAHTDELVELAKVTGDYGGRYASHLRGYCSTLRESVLEAVSIAERAGVPLQISHLHAVPLMNQFGAAGLVQSLFGVCEAVNAVLPLPGLPNPALEKGLKVINEALARGVDIGIDIVPYTMGNTTITALFPPWANMGGVERLLERLGDPVSRERIKKDIATVVPKWPHWNEGSWSDPYIKAIGWNPIKVLSAQSERNKWTIGSNFVEIGRRWGLEPFEALCRLTIEEQGRATFTFGFPARPWIEKMFNKVLRHPQVTIGADSVYPTGGYAPPSAFGCFPRVLGHYCRELGLFSLAEAVRKMTGLSATRYGLRERGFLVPGAFADITVFDPDSVGECLADDNRPTEPTGIIHVIINGQLALRDGEIKRTSKPGRILRRGNGAMDSTQTNQ